MAFARDRGWLVKGTEVSTTAIDLARVRYDLEMREGPMEEAAPPGPYDLVTMWHVIEHVPDPVRALRFCHDILAERGRIVLALPNDGDAAWAPTAGGNVVRRALRRQPSERYLRLKSGVESHIQHFDSRSVRGLLVACGLMWTDRVDDARAGAQSVQAQRPSRSVARFSMATPWNSGREIHVCRDTERGRSVTEGVSAYRFAASPAHARRTMAWYASMFEDGPVLDIGTGRGYFLEALRARGIEGIGSTSAKNRRRRRAN